MCSPHQTAVLPSARDDTRTLLACLHFMLTCAVSMCMCALMCRRYKRLLGTNTNEGSVFVFPFHVLKMGAAAYTQFIQAGLSNNGNNV